MHTLNPFLYGKSVPPDRLIGRRDAVRTVFSRLANGESKALVGEPHIDNSSLLNCTLTPQVTANALSLCRRRGR